MKTKGIEEQDAQSFVENLVQLYFEKRDMATLSVSMEERISWIGTGEDERSHNLDEAKTALAEDLVEYCGDFSVTNTSLSYTPLSNTGGIVFGTLSAVPSDRALSDENLRFSVVLEQAEDGLKLVHMHFSHADLVQEHNRHFVKQSMRKDNQGLRQELGVREHQLAALTKNIPGGVHQCANDQDLTLLSMSDGFLALFGYAREEVEQKFENKFINMIYPDDRTGMLKSTFDQIKYGSDIEIEYRVLCKNGQPMWVLDKGRLFDEGSSKACFYCLLVDITERKRQQEELRLSLERHQVIMDQATDIIFEWDIFQDTLRFSANWKKKFGYSAIDNQISDRIPLSCNIHDEDMPAFVKIMKDTAAGIPYSETEFRIRDTAGRYCWCRIRATTQYDSDQQPIKAVGVIVDIDEEKRQKQMLTRQAQYDTLTGIYNKATVNLLVEQQMQKKDAHGYQALFIIDVDHFKGVNDTYGHLCGDFVLSNVAAALKNSTRSGDFVGRVGGDEFLVYLPEVKDAAAASQKAEHLLSAVSLVCPEEGEAPITCSMGVAVLPHGTVDYQTLYKYADHALYRRKKVGRDGVTFFDLENDLDNLFGEVSLSEESPTAI